jgi:hypothetical protein
MKQVQSAVLALALATFAAISSSCTQPATPAPVTPTPITPTPQKSAGLKALENIAQQKGFTAAAVSGEADDGSEKSKVTSVERTKGDGTIEALMLVENPDGTYQLSAFSSPPAINADDEVSSNAAEGIFQGTLLDNAGLAISTATLKDIKNSEVSGDGLFGSIKNWIKNSVLGKVKKVIPYLKTLAGAINFTAAKLIAVIEARLGYNIPGWLEWAVVKFVRVLLA